MSQEKIFLKTPIDLKLALGIMIKLSEMKHYYADRTYARFRAE